MNTDKRLWEPVKPRNKPVEIDSFIGRGGVLWGSCPKCYSVRPVSKITDHDCDKCGPVNKEKNEQKRKLYLMEQYAKKIRREKQEKINAIKAAWKINPPWKTWKTKHLYMRKIKKMEAEL